MLRGGPIMPLDLPRTPPTSASAPDEGGGRDTGSPMSSYAMHAWFVGQRVPGDSNWESMVGALERGEARVGGGAAPADLARLRFPVGKPLGTHTVTTDVLLGLADRTRPGWKEEYRCCLVLAKGGCVVLAGTVEHFQVWARSMGCREDVQLVGRGKLFAFVDGTLVRRLPPRSPTRIPPPPCSRGGGGGWDHHPNPSPPSHRSPPHCTAR